MYVCEHESVDFFRVLLTIVEAKRYFISQSYFHKIHVVADISEIRSAVSLSHSRCSGSTSSSSSFGSLTHSLNNLISHVVAYHLLSHLFSFWLFCLYYHCYSIVCRRRCAL